MKSTKPYHSMRCASLMICITIGCGPSSGNTSDESSNGSMNDAESSSPFDSSWAVGVFTMERDEPAGLFLALEIPEEGRAVATRYNCDWNGGPATPDDVTPLEWRALSDSLLEVVPPVPGEKFLYGSEPVEDLFIERPTTGDGILVYSSRRNDGWPHYGHFVRGRPCEYFEGGASCIEHHYYRVCAE